MTISVDRRKALEQEVLQLASSALPSAERPKAVILVGGVAAGKTTLRRSTYSQGFVLIDASDIFIRLSQGEYFDFPDALEEPMNFVGSSLAYKILSERRPVITEIIGDEEAPTKELIDSLRVIGYDVEIVGVTCGIEQAIIRNESRSIDNISAYYSAPYQTRWIIDACKQLAARARPRKEHPPAAMAGQPIYEDSDYILFKKHGPLGIRHPMLTSLYIYMRDRDLAIKTTGKEKVFLLATIGEMAKFGYSPNDIKQSSVFQDFCEAVLSRGGVRWHVFFDRSPQQLAADYVST